MRPRAGAVTGVRWVMASPGASARHPLVAPAVRSAFVDADRPSGHGNMDRLTRVGCPVVKQEASMSVHILSPGGGRLASTAS